MSNQPQKYTRSVAVNMVIANMIGTGIFTSLGFQVMDGAIPDPFTIMLIWLLGGVISLCGATVYGEVATSVNKSGGEYAFLSELYHPLLGFISGWISLIAGFSAAIASLALATGEYFLPLLGVSGDNSVDFYLFGLPVKKLIAFLVVILVALIHLRGVKAGGIFQNIMTSVKLLLIATFIIVPFAMTGYYQESGVSIAATDKSLGTIFSLPFAGALVYVMFAYSGWNASAYIVGNLDNPKKNLPYSLIKGTLIVTIIYILLNYVFMYVCSFEELAGKVDVGNIVAVKILGEHWGLVISAVFSLALVSGISAMFIAGPRVAEEIGKDYKAFRILGTETGGGSPKYGIFLLLGVSMLLIFFSKFQEIIQYIGLTLSIFSLLTVFGVFILRKRNNKIKDSVRSWGYPVTPILFILLTLWMIISFAIADPMKLVYSLLTMIPAIIIYYLTRNVKE